MGKIMAKGRPKGSPNKATTLFREKLDAQGFSIPEKAIQLYQECEGKPMIQVRILELMASYTYSKPKPLDDEGNPADETNKVLMAIPSDVLHEALRITQERKAQ